MLGKGKKIVTFADPNDVGGVHKKDSKGDTAGQIKKRDIFFKKACTKEKRHYFCTPVLREGIEFIKGIRKGIKS